MDTRDITDLNSKQKIKFGPYFLILFDKLINKYFLKIPVSFTYKIFIETSLNNQSFNILIEVLKTSRNLKM